MKLNVNGLQARRDKFWRAVSAEIVPGPDYNGWQSTLMSLPEKRRLAIRNQFGQWEWLDPANCDLETLLDILERLAGPATSGVLCYPLDYDTRQAEYKAFPEVLLAHDAKYYPDRRSAAIAAICKLTGVEYPEGL